MIYLLMGVNYVEFYKKQFFLKKKFLIIGIGINLIKSPVLQDYKTSYLSEFTRKKLEKKTIYNLLAKEFQKKYKLS